MIVIPGPPYPGLYQHFRGDIYRVHQIIVDETNENRGRIMVLYENLETKTTIVRNVLEFNQFVHPEDGMPSHMFHRREEVKNCKLCVPRFYQMTPDDILSHNRAKVQ